MRQGRFWRQHAPSWLALALALVLVAVGCGRRGAHGSSTSGAGPHAGNGTTVATPSPLELIQEWVWTAPAGSSPGMPASDGDDIAFTVSRRQVMLLDGRGNVRWETKRAVRDVAPVFTADLVLVATEDGLVALDRASGRERWSASLGDRTNTPAVVGGKAVVTTWKGSFAAVNVADGKVAWQLKLGGDSLGPPAASNGAAVATFDTGHVAGAVAVDIASGRQRWTAPLTPDGVSAPAIESGVVIVVAADVAVHGVALDTGEERWRTPLDGSGSPEVPPLALGAGAVLVGHRLGGLALLNADDGSIRWSSPRAGAAVRGGPAGPGPNGWSAMPLNDGTVTLAGPDRKPTVREPPGLTIGVAMGPKGMLLVATEQGKENALYALSGW